ncbi:MAG: AAA family ATPase [Planctomycetes bacterium]|nr:AAA family ATPase [Planctomycetota bacterium]
MRTIAIANQKGGCGKTTVSINLAACLAREGRRTLLVDMDPQSHCALGLAVPEDQIEVSIHDVMMHRNNGERIDISRCIWQITANFDLAPSTTALSQYELVGPTLPDADERLGDSLVSVSDKYDFALVDCPPHIGMLTLNAFHAASEVIIPVDTGYFSLQGLTKQLETLDAIRAGRESPLEIHVLANLYDVRTKLGREILNELKRKYGHLMCHTFINFNTKLREGASFGQPITEYDPNSMGYRDFARLARELIAAGGPEMVPTAILRQADDLADRAEKLLATSKPLFGKGGLAETSNEMPATPEEVQKKIEHIYGVHKTNEGILFATQAPGATNVAIAGDFNNWQPEATLMERNGDGNSFVALLPLPPGRYRYRYVIDGQWKSDPHNEYVESNPFGELNSVVEV